ncbi:vesicle transport protein SFT2C [Alligator mississippiensis]|uniref:vesicle transport protein SFT2C n=1 Tax=Alligator mississippiensis TaxID=8496 RepID=UPI002877F70A|nr:vesicle transport protein SFT2C [Alligator mississippiensis]
MADLGRQLQDYLAQSRAGGGSGPGSSRAEPAEAEAGPRAWLSRLSAWPWEAEPEAEEASRCWPGLGLTRGQRLAGSALCLVLAALCFGLAALHVPLLLLRARRFALLWSLGSALALGAAALLRGPDHLLWPPSRAGALYLGALAATLYAALGLRSAALSALGAAAQLAALAACLLSLLPGGAAGLSYLGGFVRRRVAKTLPV